MLRFHALPLFAVMSVSAGSYVWHETAASSGVPAHRHHSLEPEDVDERRDRMKAACEARDRFAAYCDGVMDELVARRVGIIEGRERILFYCLREYPYYLEHVTATESGHNLREKIARNLLRGLQVAQSQGHWKTAGLPARIAECEHELRKELTAHLSARRGGEPRAGAW